MDNSEGMDMLKNIKENLDSGGKSPFESLEKIAELLNKLEMTDEEREQLKETLGNQKDRMGSFMRPAFEILPGANLPMQIALILAFLVMVTLFVFFGYKLYRSLTEKERKRDEKRKQKQMKKKK